MNITVYLGSAYGNDPDFKTKIIEPELFMKI